MTTTTLNLSIKVNPAFTQTTADKNVAVLEQMIADKSFIIIKSESDSKP